MIDYLRHYSSPFVFSASIPPAIVAAVQASFDLLTFEPEWHERLWSKVGFLLDGFKSMGFGTEKSETPVIHPGVPLMMERIRVGVMATHTREHLAKALEIFREVGRELELIPDSAQNTREIWVILKSSKASRVRTKLEWLTNVNSYNGKALLIRQQHQLLHFE